MGPSPSVRKWLAGTLFRLAHVINPPTVTETSLPAAVLDVRTATNRQLITEAMTHPDPDAAGRAVAELNERRRALAERRVSRGWD